MDKAVHKSRCFFSLQADSTLGMSIALMPVVFDPLGKVAGGLI